MDTITNTEIAGNPPKTTAVNNFKDEEIASTTTSTGLDNKTKKLEADGSNTADDKTEFEAIDTVYEIANGNETATTETIDSNSHDRTKNHVKIDDGYLDDETEKSNSPNIFIGRDINQAIDARTLKIVDRGTWSAQPPLSIEPLDCPVPYVIIAHTATEMTSTQAETMYMVRNIQTYHIKSKNWHDIAYNFLIGCDGNVYEGRGWMQLGAHSAGYNRRSIGISFVGCFTNELPPDISLEACRLLIKKGIEDGHIAKDYKLIGHCQCRSPTDSPGRQLFEEIKTWPNWAETL